MTIALSYIRYDICIALLYNFTRELFIIWMYIYIIIPPITSLSLYEDLYTTFIVFEKFLKNIKKYWVIDSWIKL